MEKFGVQGAGLIEGMDINRREKRGGNALPPQETTLILGIVVAVFVALIDLDDQKDHHGNNHDRYTNDHVGNKLF